MALVRLALWRVSTATAAAIAGEDRVPPLLWVGEEGRWGKQGFKGAETECGCARWAAAWKPKFRLDYIALRLRLS
jgi:hypothetical protein